jgi:capsular exopolysaccharide synthesis family protein
MTIIEAALEKTKAMRGLRQGPSSAAHNSTPTAATHSRHATVHDALPTTQIQARRVAFDPQYARENRLLLSSTAAEDRGAISAYGMLRTRILQRSATKGWQTIGITSATPKDGKSLTALNLALSLARQNKNLVVLLDLDMRNPSVCRTLGITPVNELRDFFEHRTESPEDFFMSIGIENLLIAGNVTATENSAELLASDRLEMLLEFIRASTAQPLILIDLPPVLSPDDALVVAPRIDALVLVASEGLTPRADLQKASELLADFTVAGLVLNRSSEESQKYGYGYGYGGGREPA